MIKCVWGHDVREPRLELPRPMPPRAPGVIRTTCRKLRAYYPQRHRKRPELLRSYRGRWKVATLVFLAWKRSETAELHVRLGQFLALHADIRTGVVGRLDSAGNLVPFTTRQFCAELECSRGQLKRAFRVFKAAGYVHRHQGTTYEDPRRPGQPTGRVAVTKVTESFWSASGTLEDRRKWIRKQDRKAAGAEREERARDRWRRAEVLEQIRQAIIVATPGRQWGWSELEREAYAELARRRRPPPT